MNLLTILKPGILRNRRGSRFIEKIFGFFPFFPGIEAKDVARTMKKIAEKNQEEAHKCKEKVSILENSELLNFLKE